MLNLPQVFLQFRIAYSWVVTDQYRDLLECIVGKETHPFRSTVLVEPFALHGLREVIVFLVDIRFEPKVITKFFDQLTSLQLRTVTRK